MRVRTPIVLENGSVHRGRFDILTRCLHWLTLCMVLVQLGSGVSFLWLEKSLYYALVLLTHRSSGSMLWVFTLLRLLWRFSFATFPPFPNQLPSLVQWAAKLSEYALYLLLLLVPITGFLNTILLGVSFRLFVWKIPALLPSQLDLAAFFHDLHAAGAWCLAGLAGVHAVAALFHHLVLKDDVLEAMLPGVNRSSSARARRTALP